MLFGGPSGVGYLPVQVCTNPVPDFVDANEYCGHGDAKEGALRKIDSWGYVTLLFLFVMSLF